MSTEEVFVALFVCSAAVWIAKLVTDAFGRRRGSPEGDANAALERRLERIENAVEAIAVEMERVGEARRFEARLADHTRERQPLAIERPVTPPS